MRRSRYEALTECLQTTARKVLNAVPHTESWTAFQISNELRRLGTPKDRQIVDGCLARLVRDGLINQSGGAYRHVEVRDTTTTGELDMNPTAVAMLKTVTPTAPTKLKPIDQLSVLSKQARILATDLTKLADDIDAAAVSIDDELANNNEDMAKLQQFRQLLKAL